MFNVHLKKTQVSESIFLIVITIISCLSIQLHAKEEQDITPYQFMHPADFIKTTGCDSIFDYTNSLKVALNFLVFSEYHDGTESEFRFSRDLSYTHRHSRQLFLDAIKNQKCKQPNIMRMGIELQILNLDGTENMNTEAIRENTKKLQLDDLGKYYLKSNNDNPMFEVLSRTDYMELTGCLVSPTTYHKYHLALFYNMGKIHHVKAKRQMQDFLNDVGAGNHNTGGTEISKQCLPNSIKVLANDLELLNEVGTYELE